MPRNQFVPNDLRSEQAVLGSMLLSEDALRAGLQRLTAADFHRTVHQRIFEAMEGLHRAGKPVDLTLLNAALGESTPDGHAWSNLLSDLYDAVATHHHIKHYAEAVAAVSVRRSLWATMHKALGDLQGEEATRDLLRDLSEKCAGYLQRLDPPAAAGPALNAAELCAGEGAPVRMIVQDIIPAGLTVMAGAPKLGKSWLALALAVTVARGGRLFREYLSEQTSVLFLALEDTPLRLQQRLHMLRRSDQEWAEEGLRNVTIHTRWPTLDGGGLDLLSRHLTEHPETGLVIVDTYQRIRPAPKGVGNAYEQDYAALGPLQQLAADAQVGILLIHHTRKGASDDGLETFNGSMGITGAPDAALVLKRSRREQEATLDVTGRDLPEASLSLTFDEGIWTARRAAGQPPEPYGSATRRIIHCLGGHPQGLSLAALVEHTGVPQPTLKALLSRLVQQGVAARLARGLYGLPDPLQEVRGGAWH